MSSKGFGRMKPGIEAKKSGFEESVDSMKIMLTNLKISAS